MARAKTRSGHPDERRETGAVHKRWHGRSRVALVYPNTYHVGMSNLGFHSIYRILNARDDVVCERAFLPADRHLPSPPRTIESRRSLADTDMIAFSLSFENDYVNVLSMLKQAGLPLAARKRGTPHPLVVAGGVACFLNPEPLAPFVDCFLLGEAETNLDAFMDRFDPGRDRQRMLETMAAEVPGTYVPAFYRVDYRRDGTLRRFEPCVSAAPARVASPVVADVDTVATQSAIITPDTAFADTRLIEVSRGCPHGCRFCSAGFAYRPPRLRSEQFLNTCIAAETGADRAVGLVGAAVSDLPFLDRLCETARRRGVRVTLSSMRADALTPSLVSAMAAGGVKTATVAPDAGSERMRSVINKGISEDQILEAAGMLVAGGIANIKLYFMVGLPTEDNADVEAIITLCNRIRERFVDASRPTGRIGAISVSINAFVPKPFTPFQWCAMDRPGALKQKTGLIRSRLKSVPNITVRVENLRDSRIQALLSRGDRRAGDILQQVSAGRLNWPAAFRSMADQVAHYTTRERDLDELLPWAFIDHGIRPDFLKREYRRALAGKPSAPCPLTPCSQCGICRTADDDSDRSQPPGDPSKKQ